MNIVGLCLLELESVGQWVASVGALVFIPSASLGRLLDHGALVGLHSYAVGDPTREYLWYPVAIARNDDALIRFVEESRAQGLNVSRLQKTAGSPDPDF